MRMFSGVLVWGVVAAEGRGALLTRPQMDPLRVDLHTFRALAAFSVFDGCNRFQMRARNISHCFPFTRGERDVLRLLQSIPRPLPTPRA